MKKSPIWYLFVIWQDSKYVECNACGHNVSRGGRTTKTLNTSNLVSHLKSKHREEYKEFEKLKAGEEQTTTSAKPRQLTLQESDKSIRVWDVNDPRAHHIHQRIEVMIAIDSQPFSTLEDEGFAWLLNTLETILKNLQLV